MAYDSFGRVEKKSVWFGEGSDDYSVEHYTYDLAGNTIEMRIEDAHQKILLQRCYSYDLQGRCTEEFYFLEGSKISLTKTRYNDWGEAITHTDALGNTTIIHDETLCRNQLGQSVARRTFVDPMGVQTEITFDALGRVVTTIKRDFLGSLLSSERYLYDTLGNKAVEIRDQIVDGEVIGSQRTEWLYGPMGRLEAEHKAVGTPEAQRTLYFYNTLGKLSQKSCEDLSINYTYNREGHLYKIESPYSDKMCRISNSYSYDRKGNVVSARSLGGKRVSRSYNAFNQVSQETIKDGEGSYTLTYDYDRRGRLKAITLPDQSQIRYLYDALFGRAVQRISSEGVLLYTHTYDNYDTQGRLLSESHVGSVGGHEYVYDLNGQRSLSRCDHFIEKYQRDGLGRIVEVLGTQPREYIYNDRSQLIAEKRETKKSYCYDSLDNCLQEDHHTRSYNSQNQLIMSSNNTFSYDSQGNLLRKVLDGKESHFTSNPLSQLISLSCPDGAGFEFSYDPFGRLLVEKEFQTKGRRKKNLSTTRYLYIGHIEIGTLGPDNSIQSLKIPGLDGDALGATSVAFEIDEELYIPLHDISGNVICLVDSQSGECVESYNYTAFGQERIFDTDGEEQSSSFVGNSWRYAEKRIHERTGFLYFGFRFYDPSVGRWISQDPAGRIDGPNLYAYLHNNPIGNRDRLGLATESTSPKPIEGYLFGEFEPHCYCEKHRTCKRGGDIGKYAGSQLPKITYDDNFEKIYKDSWDGDVFFPNFYGPSKCYDLGLSNLPADMGIGFINGIWNSEEDARTSAVYLSQFTGGLNIHGVYNATHGTTVDPRECSLGLKYIATEPVRQLHKMWNSFFERSSKHAYFLMICHSQGAIHVRNALLDYSVPLRERIIVIAIAPAAYIYQVTCAKVTHYVAEGKRDFVPKFDLEGAIRERDTIVILKSHKDANLFDHEFTSPTYRKVLADQIDFYLKNGNNL